MIDSTQILEQVSSKFDFKVTSLTQENALLIEQEIPKPIISTKEKKSSSNPLKMILSSLILIFAAFIGFKMLNVY
jgi:hypothetical protein